MNIDLQSAGIGFGLASGLLAFLGKWIFATKADLRRAEASAEQAMQNHEREERERHDQAMQRLYDKMDRMSESLADLRVKVEGLKYSRNGQRPSPSDSGSEFSPLAGGRN